MNEYDLTLFGGNTVNNAWLFGISSDDPFANIFNIVIEC